MTGADDGQVIGARLQVRIAVRDGEARLAALGERQPATVDRRVHFGELQLQSLRGAVRQRLAVEFGQKRLWVERVNVAGAALHEQKNDGLGPSRKGRWLGGEWVARGRLRRVRRGAVPREQIEQRP